MESGDGKYGSQNNHALSMKLENEAPLQAAPNKSLRIRNAYLEHLLDSAPDAIIWAEPDHRVFRVNPAFSKLFGYAPEEVMGRDVDDLIAPEESHDEAKEITHRVSEGEAVRSETMRCRKDRSPVFVDLMVSPIRMGDQQVGVCASYRDITEWKKDASALREAHKTLLTVLDSIDATIYVADMSTHEILFANRFMKECFGRDIVGEFCWRVFRGFKAPCEDCTNPRLLDREGNATGVVVWEGRNPITGKWYINYDRAIKWIDGRMVHIQVATDITRLKQAELTLLREKEYLGALHETTLGLISRLEPGELLEAILSRAAKLVGIKEGYIYLHEPETDALVLKVALGRFRPLLGFRLRSGEGLSGKVLQTGQPMLVDDYGSWPGRSPNAAFDGLHSIVGIRFRAGPRVAGVMGLGCFSRDIKFGEREIDILRRFSELASIALDNAFLHSQVKSELEQRKSAEKEKSRMEKQLLHAQKMEAIGTLASGVAHDFNNLLMGVQGNASLVLADLEKNHPHHERLSNIEQYVRKGAELTKQLLGFAKGGKHEMRATNLNELINRSAMLFIRTKKEITLHANYQEDLWPVQIDQGQIEQALLNMYINAWQSMPRGGTLAVSTRNVMMDENTGCSLNLPLGRYVKFSIVDTGIGMDKGTQERIFEPFFSTKKMGRGTGLGLASVYGIIKNHGGAIEVESQLGEGTRFSIYLPASETQVRQSEDSPPEMVKGSGTILLVDDEEMIIQVGGEILERIGYRVLSANSGEKAVELFKSFTEPIDLVILDMIMPEMSGAEVFYRLREIDPHAKVLLSSGYSMEEQARELLKKGCMGFIQKPYSMSDLARKVKGAIEQGR
jgi:PAS domain S-box-containing protein